jgi:phosphatidylethanolamine-binding protein (PEBP) family uncharacterized protein
MRTPAFRQAYHGRRRQRDRHACERQRCLVDVIVRAIPPDAAVFALIVDARDEAAARSYRNHGFQARILRD